MPNYPSDLPQFVLQDGYEETLGRGVVRTPMDAGPAKQRPRFTAAPEVFTYEQDLSPAEAVVFAHFYSNTLRHGDLSFDWVHPRLGTDIQLKYTERPVLRPRGSYYTLKATVQRRDF